MSLKNWSTISIQIIFTIFPSLLPDVFYGFALLVGSKNHQLKARMVFSDSYVMYILTIMIRSWKQINRQGINLQAHLYWV